jgi:serine/threonine-protein kinase
VLEGSVRWAGDRLRITAQLIDADGAYLWSETYERASRDIFAIQDEISRAIVDTLRVQLVKGGSAPLVKRYGEDIEIHNVFLKGRYHSNRRTEEGLTKSIDFFEEVIEKNSRHALAYAGLAESYSMLGEYSIQAPTLVMPKAKAAALKALELDPTLAEAYTSLAFIRSRYDWAWREAEEHYRRAIELNPGHSTARHWYGSDYLAILGRFEEGVAEIREALKVDPLSLIAGTSLGFTFVAMRRYDEAITQFRSLIDLDPHFFKGYSGLARAYVQKGEYDVGIALFKKAQELSGDLTYVLGSLGQSYALAGNRAAAEECLAKLLELSSQRFVPATSIALIYAGLGESDCAFEWLDRACDRREIPLGFLKVYPSYDPLRSDPRFTTLLARVGL